MKRFTLMCLIIFIAVATQAAPLQTGFTDDRSSLFAYSGTWSETVDASAYASSITETSDSTASVTLETYADGFTLFFMFDPSGGSVDVCIDGDCTSIATLGAASQGSAEFVSLADGLKTITIQKNTVDTNVFKFDAIYIHPSSGENANQESISYMFEGTTYQASRLNTITQGEIGIIVLLFISNMFQMALVVWGFVKK